MTLDQFVRKFQRKVKREGTLVTVNCDNIRAHVDLLGLGSTRVCPIEYMANTSPGTAFKSVTHIRVGITKRQADSIIKAADNVEHELSKRGRRLRAGLLKAVSAAAR